MKFASYLVPVLAALVVSAAQRCLSDDQANAIITKFFTVYEGGPGLDGINDFVADDIQVIYPIGNHNSLNPVATGRDQFRKLVSGISDGTATRYKDAKLTNVFSFNDHRGNIAVYVRSDFTLTDVGPNAPSANTVNTVGAANSAQSFFGMHFLSADCSTGLVHTIRSFDDEIHFLGLQGVDPITLF